MQKDEQLAKRSRLIKQAAERHGFMACGIAKADFLQDHAPRLEQWLKDQRQATMSYMERNFDKRLDPRKLVEGSKSVVSLLFNYYPPESARLGQSHFKISKYAYGEDYHRVIKDKLKAMLSELRDEIGQIEGRAFVDSAPILEKAWAERSGLGWIAKNSNLINKRQGSFFFLAELIIDLECAYDTPITTDHCGSCTACIEACPTEAIVSPMVVDAGKCISYFTIELKEAIPSSFKGSFDDWAFGCDTCQDVCPWNRFSSPHGEPRLLPTPAFQELDAADMIELTEETFKQVFSKSALKRTKFSGLKRNIDFFEAVRLPNSIIFDYSFITAFDMSKARLRREALVYHAKPQPGKIKIVPTKPYQTQRDLALAYSPGVAEPCLEIEKNPNDVYKYTSKGNVVAVISNGTAVLGLGDIGPLASKPVMEGKSLLFKIFADIDGIDIEVDTKDVDAFVETVKRIAPTFGGINLEDIKAPEAFEIERRLKEELDIPVMHDDQHGTAIISAAALLNALELAEKKIEDVRIVVSGAGAAAISCTKLYKAFGARSENIVMLDSKGVIQKTRENLDPSKLEFATSRTIETLEEAMVDADVFIGLSIADIVSEKMLLSMAKNPIVFAMANPNPEIDYNLALRTREDVIMATGRSDHPNQVNNVLGFPFIFRGALDVRATKINEEMKMAAVRALAELTKEPVPEQVNITYDITKLSFGREYIIPKPFDPRLITKIPAAVAKAAMDSGVAQEEITDWERYEDELMARSGTDNKFIRSLHDKARSNPKKVVFAEADQIDVLKAAQFVYDEGIAIPILLGDKEVITSLKEELEFDADLLVLDPGEDLEQERRDAFADLLWKRGERNGVQKYSASVRMEHRNYYGPMMVLGGEADAMISGYSRSFPKVLLPVLETVGRGPGVKRASTMNIMITPRGPMFLADTAININPSAEELAEIAVMTAKEVKAFGFEPVVAMLSFSNYGSSKHPEAKKVKEAVRLLHQNHPDLVVDGEIQADFALNQDMGAKTFPFSKLANRRVNTLVFPNLDAANITYKLLKELHGVKSVGPVMLGLEKPIHILQLGASVEEIINMTAIAVIDAQLREKSK